MKLYHFPNTRSARVLWTAIELGEELDIAPVNLQKGEHRSDDFAKLNPYQQVPVAEVDGTVLIESGALCQFLIENSDNGDKLLPPAGSAERARCYQLAWHAPATLDAITIPAYLQLRFAPEDKRDQAMIDKSLATWREKSAPWAAAQLGDKTWLCGDDFTFADIMAGYDLFFAKGLGVLEGHANLEAYVGRYMEREAFGKCFALG